MKRVEKFLKESVCPDCGGTRLSAAARAPRLRGISLDEACAMTLSELINWVQGVPGSLPEEMRPMAESICEAFESTAKRLMDLGLGYLTLDRSASTLSTGERQRMQLARAVRNRTTGVLYVLDEPSIGLHPSNIVGLTGVMHDLVADGNSVILVDHDTQILKEADWIVEMGPEAGAKGGYVIAEGTIPAIEKTPSPRSGRSSRSGGNKAAEVRGERGTFCQRRHSSFDRADPYREAAGGAYPPRGGSPLSPAYPAPARQRWCWKASSPRWMRTSAARRCRSTSAPSVRRASRTLSSSMPRPSGSTSAPQLPPTRAYTTSCEGSTRSLPTQRSAAIRRAIFPTIPAPCAAPDATERALSVWTFNSCRT